MWFTIKFIQHYNLSNWPFSSNFTPSFDTLLENVFEVLEADLNFRNCLQRKATCKYALNDIILYSQNVHYQNTHINFPHEIKEKVILTGIYIFITVEVNNSAFEWLLTVCEFTLFLLIKGYQHQGFDCFFFFLPML